MKRKRGNKKSKPKRPPLSVANKAVQNVEDDSGLNNIDNEDYDSGMEAGTPSSTGTGADLPEKCSSINSVGLPDKTATKAVYGRVKVKIKTSKMLDSQLTSSDTTTPSDTEKGGQQVLLEKPGVVGDRTDDSSNSLPEGVLGNLPKKAGNIKIKSSRGFSSSSINPCSNNELLQGERIYHKEPESINQSTKFDGHEVNTALEVIKKVMKMEAAEPFNVPVNPIVLGIPDYFDVIDTPMDFGTIRSNLESGAKYMNSEDVYRDVQYIWDNCYKYNNKGDYILELMKRVKKNFMKCWTAAGLYSEQLPILNGVEAKDVAPSSHGKVPGKSDQSKNKSRRRPGIKWHKEDCLCAICVMMRRKHEREESAQIVDDQVDTSDPFAQEVKLEEISPVESEDTSSNMGNSPDQDADADSDEKGEEVMLVDTKPLYSPKMKNKNEMMNQMNSRIEYSEQTGFADNQGGMYQCQISTLESISDVQNDTQDQMPPVHRKETAPIEQQKSKESLWKRERDKVLDNIHKFENPLVTELCGTLLANNNTQAVWNGPHSLVKHRDRSSSDNDSIMHSAIASFFS